MNKQDEDLFRTHATLPEYQRVLTQTLTNLRKMNQKFSNISVSVSGGKDSLVMLDLALRVFGKKIWVWHWDFGIFMLPDFEQEVQKILIDYFKIPIDRLIIRKRQSCSEDPTIGYKAMFGAISHHVQKHDIDICLIGLRAEESIKRKHFTKKQIRYNDAVGCFDAFPMAAWQWKDIWAYLVTHRIPYLSSYDHFHKIKPWSEIRFVSFFDPEFEKFGGPEQDKFLFWDHRQKNKTTKIE
jgi:3'-phosphoadenosine 5'-phosphosulfate sulfotransferase (PAPS reductase)/FAD synthetase